MLIFGYDAYLKLQALQSGEIAQGVRVVNQVTDVEQPTYRYWNIEKVDNYDEEFVFALVKSPPDESK